MAETGKGLANIRLFDLVVTAVVALVAALLVRQFVIGTFTIPSHSMENTLLVGDNILVSKLHKWFGGIERGDVVVFSIPDSLRQHYPDEPFIKRVIGIAGDTIVLTSVGIAVNNRLIPAPPLSASSAPTKGGEQRFIVPQGHIFVMGDNRANSWDSRYWGPLPDACVIGRPLFIYWSRGTSATDTATHIRWNRILKVVE